MSVSTRCAACKYLRRRCCEDCVLAPYFPSTQPERFACVHRIFGASNVSRLLQQLPVHQRAQTAESISMEAYWRVQDPVYGSVGIISRLQREISTIRRDLAKIRAQIGLYASPVQIGPQHDQPLHPSLEVHRHQNEHLDADQSLLGFFPSNDFF